MSIKSMVSRSCLGAILSISLAAPSHALLIDSGGFWSNPGVGSITNLSGTGTNVISWGDPATNAGKSSYTFNGVDNEYIDNAALDGATFNLGEFIHDNNPVFGTSITTVDLTVEIDFLDDLENVITLAQSFAFTFGHNETPNSGTCNPTGATICPDVVSVPTTTASGVVSLFGDTYSLDFVGFLVNGAGTPVSQFITEERQANSAQLIAQLNRVNVSEPATISLMALSLFGLAALRRRARS